MPDPIQIPKGSIWISRGRKTRVMVVNIARHGEDCSSLFVFYTNLQATEDFPAGERWILGSDCFLARFERCLSRAP